MSLDLLFEKYRAFISEEELVESRLSDTKKKYPKLGEWVDFLAKNDPSGKNKYLMWMAKQLSDEFDSIKTLPREELQGVVNSLIENVKVFHRIQNRLKKKDINQYSWKELENTTKEVPQSGREKRKKEKERAMEGSEIIFEDDDFFIVRPNTTKSSCFYGRGTKWCISATTSRNYFMDYSSQGKTFYFLRNENLSEEDDGRKLAFVFGSSGDLEEIFDSPDNSISESDAVWHVSRNLHKSNPELDEGELDELAREKMSELVEEMSDHAEENPPEDEEGEYERIAEYFNNRFEYMSIRYEIDDAEGYVAFDADGFIDLSDLEWKKVENIDKFRFAKKIENIARDEFEKEDKYLNYISFENYSGRTFINFSIDVSDYVSGHSPGHFEELGNDVQAIDDEIGSIKEGIVEKLEDAGLVKSSAYSDIKNILFKMSEFENLDVEAETGEITISAQMRIHSETNKDDMHDIDKMIRTDDFKKYFLKNIKGILDKAEEFASKQLELPLKEEKMKVPYYDNIQLTLVHFGNGEVVVDFDFVIKRQFTEIDIKMLYNFAKFLDKNFDRIEEIFAKVYSKGLTATGALIAEEQKINIMKNWRKFLRNEKSS